LKLLVQVKFIMGSRRIAHKIWKIMKEAVKNRIKKQNVSFSKK
jgi:hypothetical protein